MQRRRKPATQLKIAKERMDILFKLAQKEFKKNPARSRRYVELARKIGMRYNVRLTKDMKRKACKKCNTLLKRGSTAEFSSEGKFKVIKCKKCNKVYRYVA